ncbi:uncharacterized protein LOC115631542 [Scaptodrosophila lebanonensis]|uniref:Uncharacterized protein LOC115631542 n=1 Tax=Drosophila lebanonensis TaxID=7225 RepID=A0A6J2UAI7_DROLE|nr:uncharacterized protein LOC115631542 [Scaptodrosophila lebanonensis]
MSAFAYAVLFALIVNLFLSATALRCHQCNSHDNDDCSHLIVNTPRGQRDNQFLLNCDPKGSAQPFCRKTVLKFEVNDEHRIERSCGWIEEKTQNVCFTADSEGFKQTICTCAEEGCNGAPTQLNGPRLWYSLSATAFSLVMAGVLRH